MFYVVILSASNFCILSVNLHVFIQASKMSTCWFSTSTKIPTAFNIEARWWSTGALHRRNWNWLLWYSRFDNSNKQMKNAHMGNASLCVYVRWFWLYVLNITNISNSAVNKTNASWIFMNDISWDFSPSRNKVSTKPKINIEAKVARKRNWVLG